MKNFIFLALVAMLAVSCDTNAYYQVHFLSSSEGMFEEKVQDRNEAAALYQKAHKLDNIQWAVMVARGGAQPDTIAQWTRQYANPLIEPRALQTLWQSNASPGEMWYAINMIVSDSAVFMIDELNDTEFIVEPFIIEPLDAVTLEKYRGYRYNDMNWNPKTGEIAYIFLDKP